jgi:hypothetical protein
LTPTPLNDHDHPGGACCYPIFLRAFSLRLKTLEYWRPLQPHEVLGEYHLFADDAVGQRFPFRARLHLERCSGSLHQRHCDCDYDHPVNHGDGAVLKLSCLHLRLLKAKRERAPLAKIHS